MVGTEVDVVDSQTRGLAVPEACEVLTQPLDLGVGHDDPCVGLLRLSEYREDSKDSRADGPQRTHREKGYPPPPGTTT